MSDPSTNTPATTKNQTKSEHQEVSSRTGRKGDPRMHKAVAARSTNPTISLFHALIKGGFEYDEDDPNAIDSEGVALGQRKNQLSRRLRYASKKPTRTKRKSDELLLSDDPAASWNGANGVTSEGEGNESARMARDHPQFKQLLVRHHTTTDPPDHAVSGVAVTQLLHIASTVGMTLEQLAVSLANNRNLAQALKGTTGRQDMALAFYKAGARKLRVDCMLQAGYPKEIAQDESSEDFQEFALQAWKQEGDSIQKPPGHDTNLTFDPPVDSVARRERSLSICATERHLHRLEGKCGHRPILHQPRDGPPHIDFMIGDRVECFQDVQPMIAPNTNESSARVWPSKFNCQELKCAGMCPTEKEGDCGHEHEHEEFVAAPEPKILDVNKIDFDCGEWNIDFSNDSSLLGLFKLGSAPESLDKMPGDDESYLPSGGMEEDADIARNEKV